ncbi:MAG: hypothetical protein NZ700_11510 [Gemmataceae bacterium]|nr:hypothetical protein [Gemmataceae bacterium]MDW8265557.1 hypothetical protein [Gemmataceae bacterium]
MAHPLQQPAMRRKAIYLGLIVVLFTAAWLVRIHWVEVQAEELGTREQSLGDVELIGSAVRLGLTGSRGLVICSLWLAAEEKKKRHEWNELDLLRTTLTRLQPDFSSPWRFHSWDLAYNVSVELEEGNDQYFYICRGIQLLGEGVRRLRRNPDLRYEMGIFYQMKFGFSDDARLLQSLFQLSCIDPVERDPRRFRTPDGQIDREQLEAFCRKHPHLVRRLREKRFQEGRRVWYQPRTAEDLLDFLARHQKIPSRYEAPEPGIGLDLPRSRLKPASEQFPVLPPKFSPEEPAFDEPVGDDYSGLAAARTWFTYAQELVPPPTYVAGPTPAFDPRRHAVPRLIALPLFRAWPALTQTLIAQELQKEGWFDGGWDVDDGWHDSRSQWFPGKKVVIGAQRNWSAEAWERAYRMWRRFGLENGLLLEPDQRQALEGRAARYRATLAVSAEELGPEPPAGASAELHDSAIAHRQLYWYHTHRRLTNFAHFYHQAEVERLPEANQVRKLLYQADRLRRRGEPAEVCWRLYAEAFSLWADLLARYPDYRLDSAVQEEVYEKELRAHALFQEARGTVVKQLLTLHDWLVQAASFGPGVPSPQALPARAVPLPSLAGPFELRRDEEGRPWISPEAIDEVRSRQKLFGEVP